jgi:integrase/recombinase XerD
MLSLKLLELLRTWWRMERPTQWLFPGDRPGQAISKGTVEQACQKARRRCGIPTITDETVDSGTRGHASIISG